MILARRGRLLSHHGCHPAFTIYTYQHLIPGMRAAAAERFANLIANADR